MRNSESQNPNPNPESEDPSQNSKPSTPKTQNPLPENPFNQPQEESEEPHVADEDQDDHEPEPEPEPENDQSEGMNVSVSPHHPSMSSEIQFIAQEFKGSNNPSASVRRTSKRKKGNKNNHVSKIALERKMLQLSQGFKPIPFVPLKVLDFSRYEEFLKKLELWDFAHIEFDRNIRVDLIGKLIVSYNPKNRCSYVDESRIGVSRADLGRALKLPKKLDCEGESFPVEFLSFLDEFVANWMILHEDEDLWCMPKEIVGWTKLIRDGTPQKVDWAGLMWFMVEKELAQRTSLKECYYASHLQQMIKAQKEELFRESPNMEVEKLKVEASVGQKLEDQNTELRLGQDCAASVECAGDAGEIKEDNECLAGEMEKVEDFEKEKEEDNIGISRGVDEGNKVESTENAEHVNNIENVDHVENFDHVEDVDHIDNVENSREGNKGEDNSREGNKGEDMMGFEDDMGEEQGQGQWFLDNKIGGQHFLQRCSMAGANVSEVRGFEDVSEDVEDDEVDGDGHVEGFNIMPKSPLNGMTSTNLIQAFQTGQLPYSTELGGQSSLELLASTSDNDVMMGAPSMFNHIGKREMDNDHDISHHALNGNNKRMRLDGNWEDKPPEFNYCVDQLQYWIEKAKICRATEKNEDQQASMAQQHYMEQQLSAKDCEIMQLNYKLGDLERSKQAEVNRRDRELYLMNSVIDGYRRALKQTQKAFADYRKRCQVPDEPIYKDAGFGGVVKSVMELEREKLKQDEENKVMCKIIEETYWKNLKDLEVKWDSEVLAKFQSHDSRLMDAAKEMELLKDRFRKRAMSANIQTEVTELQGPSE
uniref:Uncharacterized protein n=1 Tax=Chenopodium quinoa TaxID=63459 RepID=A0A803N1Q2_CHEQI